MMSFKQDMQAILDIYEYSYISHLKNVTSGEGCSAFLAVVPN